MRRHVKKLLVALVAAAMFATPTAVSALSLDGLIDDEVCVDIMVPIDIGRDGDEEDDEGICLQLSVPIDLPF